jgi:hypothetical protein
MPLQPAAGVSKTGGRTGRAMKLLILIFLVWLLATWISNAGGRMDRAAAIPPKYSPATDLIYRTDS